MPVSQDRKGTNSQAVRDGILAAARRCFARDGYHGTSIKGIAAAAEIRSPSILHYHFANKEALFLEVMRSAIADLTERATAVGLQLTEGPRGLGALEAFFDLLDHEGDLGPLLIECLATGMRSEHRHELSALLQGIEALVEDATRKLLGPEADRLPLRPGTLAATILDLFTGHVMRARLSPDPEALREHRRGVLTLLSLVKPIS